MCRTCYSSKPLSFAFYAALLLLAPSSAQQNKQGIEFTKFDYVNYKEGILWTATVTFARGDTEVDLVSVVHVADPEYYREVQRELSSCDKVFFELVASTPPNRQGVLTVSRIQFEVGELLGLVHQLTHIDYNQPNFIHADLSWQEILDLVKGGKLPPPPKEPLIKKIVPNLPGIEASKSWRGKDPYSPEVMKEAFAQAPELKAALKVAFGKLFGDIRGAFIMLNADLDRESILITKRNTRAMQIIMPYLKGKTRVAILYGAAHMPDFAKRLLKEGFKPVYVRWHMAWRVGKVPHKRWF